MVSKSNPFLLTRLFVCLAVCSLLFVAPAQSQFVHTQGTSIKDAYGQDLYFKGMNLGNWLLWEGYLMMDNFEYRTHTQFFNEVQGVFGGDLSKATSFEHEWRLNYVSERTISELKGLGFNSVRVPFHFNMFWDASTNSTTNHGFQYIDQLVQYCEANGVYILLDMHAAPGFQNPGDHSDNTDSDATQPRETVKFWDSNNVDIASQVWRHIADHYKDEPIIWGYDLINEPVPQHGREYELLGSMKTMRDAIRQVDNNHIIVAEGSWWGSELDKLDWTDSQVQSASGITAKWDDNLVYHTHHYDVTSRSSITSADIQSLNDRKALCDRLGVPMMMGEYGENTLSWITELTNWCVTNDVDAFPWAFKKVSHDKSLWTINPNTAFNTLKSNIVAGSVGASGLYDYIISFCQNNIDNGSAGLVWDDSFYDAVKIRLSCTDANTVSLPGRVRAINYCNSTDVGDENTNDEGGGRNVGWIDSGDWLDFKVNVRGSGNYDIKFRVATGDANTTRSIELRDGSGTTLATSNFQVSGGFQDWETVTTSADLVEGIQTMRVYFPNGGVNINWIEAENNFAIPDPFLNEWNGTAWSTSSAPEGAENVKISGNYSFSTHGAFNANNLEIESGFTLTVDGDNTLKINGNLTNNGNLVVASGASLLTYAANTTSGNTVEIKRNTRYIDGKYSFVGSPVAQNSGTTSSDLGSNVYTYDEAQSTVETDLSRWVQTTGTDQLVAGRGYTQAFQKEIVFEGTPNTGTIIYSGSYTNDGWHLVSNPYAAAIFIDDFLDANLNTTDAVYIWDDNNSQSGRGSNDDYIVANKMGATDIGGSDNDSRWNDHIGSAQGFFVKLDGSAGDITFTEGMRRGDENADGNFFRKEESKKPMVRLNLKSADGLHKQAIVGWNNDVLDDEITEGYDAEMFNTKADYAIYTEKTDTKLTIQTVTAAKQEMPLGINVAEAGTYLIEISLENGYDGSLDLYDALTEEQFDLTQGAYSFTTHSGQITERFKLMTASTVLDLDDSQRSIYTFGKTLFINHSQEGKKNYQLFNLSGKLILDAQVSGSTQLDLCGVPSGIYLVSDGIVSKKVILK